MSERYIRHEVLRNETERLKTMERLRLNYEDKMGIVKAGFYYDPNIKDFMCFSCNLIVPKLVNLQSMIRKHYRYNPHCSFLRGYDVSIRGDPRIGVKGRHDIHDASYFNRDLSNDFMTAFLRGHNLIQIPILVEPNRYRGQIEIEDIEYPDFIPGGGHVNEIFDVEKFFLMMRSEEKRRQTFHVDFRQFPIDEDTRQWPDMFAKNGFFYTLTQRNIQCAMCRIVLGDLCAFEDRDLVAIHNRVSPRCPWSRGDRHNNIPNIILNVNVRPANQAESNMARASMNDLDPIDADFSSDDDSDIEIVAENPTPRTIPPARNIIVTETASNPNSANVRSSALNDQPSTSRGLDIPPTSREEPMENNNEIDNARICKCCYSNEINVVHQCGHLSICQHCADRLLLCILCKQILINPRRIYFN